MATRTRTITATTPDGYTVSVNVGVKRQVGAIRITAHPEYVSGDVNTGWAAWCGQGVRWMVSVHKTLEAAIAGPNQTTAWNGWERQALAIGTDGEPTGPWLPATR